jgi:hypothetical protein
MRAFFVPGRALAIAPEEGPAGADFFDDLRCLAVLTELERVAVLRLDLVLVMGALRGLRDAIRRTTSAPLRQIAGQGLIPKRPSPLLAASPL